jgi:hypothetical protein
VVNLSVKSISVEDMLSKNSYTISFGVPYFSSFTSSKYGTDLLISLHGISNKFLPPYSIPLLSGLFIGYPLLLPKNSRSSFGVSLSNEYIYHSSHSVTLKNEPI